MNAPTVVILLIVALVVFLAILKRRNRSATGSSPWPFYVKRLLTQPEQVLYHRLVKSRRPRAGSNVAGSWCKEGLPVS
jgi:hypothetical protein